MAFNPSEVAHRLRGAMKGFGTNDQELISAITSINNQQLQQVREWYSKEISRDLLEDIKSETSGEYEQALTGLILLPEEYDAKCLHKAMKGLGTDEDVFVQHLCHRTTQEIQAIDAAYLAMFGKKLAYDIENDFSGEGLKVAIGLVKYNRENPKQVIPAEVDAWVDVLYNAGEGKMGTDEDTFVEAICSSGPTWLKAVNEAYGRKHGHTLVGAVEKEFSGFAAKALEAMVQEHDEYYAKLIRKATESAGTNEDVLTRVIVSRRPYLKNINNRFMDEYNVTIAYVIESEVGSDIGKLLKAAVEGA